MPDFISALHWDDVAAGYLIFAVFNAFVRGMPEPNGGPRKWWYVWLYNSLHILLLSVDKFRKPNGATGTHQIPK